MSLYGYKRTTTPCMDRLAASDNGFISKKGVSAANATRSTLPLFYNVQYHPLDTDMVKHQPANLFRLAKSQGFKTFYISAQNVNCLNGVNTSYIDYIAAFEHQEDLVRKIKDDAVLKLMREIRLSDRNFIVLHQRNSHSPYVSNYAHRPEFGVFPTEGVPKQTAHVNAYDNSVRYSDWFYNEIISHFEIFRINGPHTFSLQLEIMARFLEKTDSGDITILTWKMSWCLLSFME